jgi:hypothetical protein
MRKAIQGAPAHRQNRKMMLGPFQYFDDVYASNTKLLVQDPFFGYFLTTARNNIDSMPNSAATDAI